MRISFEVTPDELGWINELVEKNDKISIDEFAHKAFHNDIIGFREMLSQLESMSQEEQQSWKEQMVEDLVEVKAKKLIAEQN